jgi:hypothetical protein
MLRRDSVLRHLIDCAWNTNNTRSRVRLLLLLNWLVPWIVYRITARFG